MTRITEKWISSIELADGIKDTFFCAMIAASIEKHGMDEKYRVLYNACIDYIRDYCQKRDTFTEDELVRIVNCAKGALADLDEYIFDKSELNLILLKYNEI